MPNPVGLLIRFGLTLAVVLGLALAAQQSVLLGLAPLIQAALENVQNVFHVASLDVVSTGQQQVLRLVAVLREPLHINDHWIYPEGWLGAPVGSPQVSAFQVDLTAGGIISYSLLLLIIVLAWPAGGLAILGRRAIWGMLLSLVLLLVNVITTFPAEVWALIHDALAPQEIWPLLVWSKMLMGGVGLMLAIAGGAWAIALGGGSRRHRLL